MTAQPTLAFVGYGELPLGDLAGLGVAGLGVPPGALGALAASARELGIHGALLHPDARRLGSSVLRPDPEAARSGQIDAADLFALSGTCTRAETLREVLSQTPRVWQGKQVLVLSHEPEPLARLALDLGAAGVIVAGEGLPAAQALAARLPRGPHWAVSLADPALDGVSERADTVLTDMRLSPRVVHAFHTVVDLGGHAGALARSGATVLQPNLAAERAARRLSYAAACKFSAADLAALPALAALLGE